MRRERLERIFPDPGHARPAGLGGPGVWVLFLLAGLAWVPIGCAGGAGERPAATKAVAEATPISWTHYDVPAPPQATPELLARGETLYAENCSSCHGTGGAGDGTCAGFLSPAPRNFTTGTFRFKTTPGDEMPTDQDLFRTISLGLHGTGMPPWKFLTTDEDRWALVAKIKTFSASFKGDPGTAVDLGEEPPAIPADWISKGRQIYVDAGCGKCHGAEGYGDGPSSLTLKDSFGNAIPPRNFHKPSQFKRGHTPRDIALTIHTGNNGTPMPAFDEAYTPEQIWQLAAYVMSLGEKNLDSAGTPASATQGESLGEPDVVVKLTERHWKYIPDTIRLKQGQVARIEFQPTDNGLGVGHGFAIDGYDKSAFINGAMVQRPKSVTFVASKAGTFTFYCATQCSTGSLHPRMNGTLIVEAAD